MREATKDVKKQEASLPEGVERTRAKKVYAPPVDIMERNDDILLIADMPGVEEKNLDITIEKNILTIDGKVEAEEETQEGYELRLAEYDTGDYHRVFTLSEEIDTEKIEASLKNGVLRLALPKAESVKTRKIPVKSEG